MVFSEPNGRAFAARELTADDASRVDDLRFGLRQLRITREGVRPKAHLSRDYWTTDDRLDYRLYVEAIAAFIRHRDSKPPLTIGIKGPWGAGKTSLMRMIQAELDPPANGRPRSIELTSRSRDALTKRRWWRWRLRKAEPDTRVTNAEVLRHAKSPVLGEEDEPPALEADLPRTELPPTDWRATAWFNPWTYQSSEQVWAGLAHAILSQITGRLKTGDRERFWMELNLARLDRLAVRRRVYRLLIERLLPFLVVFGLTLLAAAVLWASGLGRDAARWVLAGGTGVFTVGGLLRYLAFRRQHAASGFDWLLQGPTAVKATANTAGLIDAAFPDPAYAAKAGFLHLVHADMARVLQLVATEDRPLVVFVDDLDRCSPGVVAQVIEAINLFLAGEFENCVFLLAMEPEVVAAHVEVAYAELVQKLGDDNRALGWRFLEKIVQLPLSLPVIDDQLHVPGYVRALLGLPSQRGPHSAAMGSGAARPSTTGTDGQPSPMIPKPTGTPAVSAPPPANRELVDQMEARIRGQRPTLESLPERARRVEREIAAERGTAIMSPGALRTLVNEAADRIFADLYSDSAAYDVVEAALPALRSANPREIKRYVNLFRFYSFITFAQRLRNAAAPDNAQVAKMAALAIRWPDLLSILGRDHCTVLAQLEHAARSGDDQTWGRTLTECRCLLPSGDRRAHLRDFLAGDPEIASVARALL